jgi:HEPN domain-containing protein
MPNPVSELAREWLTRAENDLRVARFLLTMPDPPPESVGFHAQQCAEKALKAYLTYHRLPFERRHDLNYLIDLCIPLEEGFGQFRILADTLSPYAVEFRYPDALTLICMEPVREGVTAAELIYAFVAELLEGALG